MTIMLTNGNKVDKVSEIIQHEDSLGRIYFSVIRNEEEYKLYPSEIFKIVLDWK